MKSDGIQMLQRTQVLKPIDAEMNTVSSHNMTISPAFYGTEVDICHPLKAYSPHNKRTTSKL